MKLNIAEQFYSIQGEGPTAGSPAVFLRLAGCNLRCNGFSYRAPDTDTHLGCDSKLVWRRGKRCDIQHIITDWQQQGWLQKLNAGAHLIITGGEPLLQQPGLVEFIHELDKITTQPVFIELETNASRPLQPQFMNRLNRINASPKLSNSGEPRSKAYQPEILSMLARSANTRFKFVIQQPADVDEVINDFVLTFDLKPTQIWLMAEGGTADAIQQRAPWLVELCKQHLFHYSPRLQIDIWGEVTGV